MSCIAVQVKTGHEMETARKVCTNTGLKTIALVQDVTTLDKRGNIKHSFKSVVSSYILVEAASITAELWHKIKECAGVIKILDGHVEDNEVEHIQNMCYSVVELTSDTYDESCEEKIIAKTPVGEIKETVKNGCRKVVLPYEILAALNSKEIISYLINRCRRLKNTLRNRYIAYLLC